MQQDLSGLDGDRIRVVRSDLYFFDRLGMGNTCINNGSKSLINRNFCRFQKSSDSLLQSRDSCLFMLMNAAQISLYMVYRDAKLCSIAYFFIELGRME